MQRVVAETFAATSITERRDPSLLKERVRADLKRFVQKQTGSRPLIMPVVVEI
jgi:ribonuclease J